MKLREMKCSIGALVASRKLEAIAGTPPDMLDRIAQLALSYDEACSLDGIKYVGVTDEFKKVIGTFKVAPGEIPPGFRPDLLMGADGAMLVDLHRDISYEKNGKKRPTNVLFSANAANPEEIGAMKNLIASVTTNPQIIYEQFLNNPKANVGGKFKDKFEVLSELAKLLGPGVDISCEVNNPFAPESELMEEIARMEEILTRYQLVVKVPHTGPLGADNIQAFMGGKLENAYDEGVAANFFYGHNFTHKLSEQGYRVNFTLMMEPHQTALALLAKPYFINAFVENRWVQSTAMADMLAKLDDSGDLSHATALRQYMIANDMLSISCASDKSAVDKARELLDYRRFYDGEGADGLDSVRHTLRVMRQTDLPDCRLIICNTKSHQIYYNIDKLLAEPEFADMNHRVVLTCSPDYFGMFSSAPGVYYYQRAFLNSVK